MFFARIGLRLMPSLPLVAMLATLVTLLTDRIEAQSLGANSFRKITLNPQFYSEGIHFGDLNRDGVNDIIAGPYWYPGPAFTEKKIFRSPRATPFPTSGDSDCYTVFLFDFNQDGWLDILSFRRDGGSEAVWYENPKTGTGFWTEHLVHSAIENESAALVDIDGDGKPEIITNSKGFGGWLEADWERPTSPWAFRSVTARQSWGTFTHGIGAGDVDGDGRLDLLFNNGWWKQPANPADTPWVHTPATLGGRANPSEGLGGAQMFAYDVNGDGDQDIITSHQAHGWGLAWHENTGQGRSFTTRFIMNTPAERGLYGLAFSQLHAVALADLDGDGLKDIITGKRKGAHGNGLGADIDSPAVLYAFKLTRNLGQGPQYQPILLDGTVGVGTQLTVADVNGDGSPDILTARRDGAYAFLNQIVFSSGVKNNAQNIRGPLRNSYVTHAHSHGNRQAVPWLSWRWNLLGRIGSIGSPESPPLESPYR